MFAGFEKKQFGTVKVWQKKYCYLVNVLHWHDEIELIYVNDGSALIRIEDEDYRIGSHEAVLVAPRQLHFIRSEPNAILTVFLVDNSLTAPFLNIKPSVLPLGCSVDIEAYSRLIHDACRQKKPYYETYVNSLTAAMIAELYGDTLSEPIENSKKHNKLIEVFRIMEEEYATVSFRQLCDNKFYSPGYLSRVIKLQTGISFTDYLNYIRINHAIDMLKENKSVTETAEQCGFKTTRQFNRVFRQITSYSPRQLPENFSMMDVMRVHTAFDPTDKASVVLDKSDTNE